MKLPSTNFRPLLYLACLLGVLPQAPVSTRAATTSGYQTALFAAG